MSKIRFLGEGPNEAHVVESEVSSTPGFDQSHTQPTSGEQNARHEFLR
jgi:hypothetical protein